MNESVSISAQSRLAITYRAIGDLIPDPRNARSHPKRQIDQIRASIEAFGFTNPILADPDGNIIAGHGRLQAARVIGLAEVPVINLPGLSEAQKRTLRIADNKIALGAGWDLEILQLELGELASIDVDIDPTLTGFSTGEIDVILTSAVDPDDEVIPPVPATPRTKPGDIWILGEHRVGCGDGRDAEFLQRVVGHGARVDAAFLDPPYNAKEHNVKSDIAASVANSFAALDRQGLRSLGARLHANTVFVMKLRDRLIAADTMPIGFKQRLADEIRAPFEAVIAYFSGGSIVSAPAYYRSDQKPQVGEKQSFEEAVRSSGLTSEQQSYLLSL